MANFPSYFVLQITEKQHLFLQVFVYLKIIWIKKKVKTNYKEVESVPLINTILLKEWARLSDIIKSSLIKENYNI